MQQKYRLVSKWSSFEYTRVCTHTFKYARVCTHTFITLVCARENNLHRVCSRTHDADHGNCYRPESNLRSESHHAIVRQVKAVFLSTADVFCAVA